MKKIDLKYLEKKAKKKEWWCWSQWFWHYVALYPTKLLLLTKITPNQVTVFWILLQFVAGFLLLGTYWSRVVGILLFNFVITILDCVDGNLARAKKIESPLGIYLEQVGMHLGTPIVFLALSFRVYSDTQALLYLWLGGIGSLLYAYSRLFNVNPVWFGSDKQERMTQIYAEGSFRNKRSLLGYISNIFRRGQPFNLLFFGVLFNFLNVVIIGYFFSFLFEALRKLVTNLIQLKKVQKRGLTMES